MGSERGQYLPPRGKYRESSTFEEQDRQRGGQLRPERALDRGVGRDHARQPDRLVRHLALALPRLDAAHRGQRVPLAGDRIVNARLGYRFNTGWRVQLELLNAKADQISYAYGSLIKTDNLFVLCNSATPPPTAVCQNGVMDRILHPVEPLAARLTVTATF